MGNKDRLLLNVLILLLTLSLIFITTINLIDGALECYDDRKSIGICYTPLLIIYIDQKIISSVEQFKEIKENI